uniref:Uncharacterized protein n=1 Tax=Rhabditophanes sp. KR3021 TaxID=114890 RepID=A0AC35TL92_9BILA
MHLSKSWPTSTMISCDMGSVSESGQYSINVVRTPKLVNATLKYQKAVNLTIKGDYVAIMEATTTAISTTTISNVVEDYLY